jgi:hypothetical protein
MKQKNTTPPSMVAFGVLAPVTGIRVTGASRRAPRDI